MTHSQYSMKNFMPLIIIFLAILSFTLIRQWYAGWQLAQAMNDFMAGFFLVFGGFKIFKLSQFAEAYATYDILAKRSKLYAYAYPFLELILGCAYLFNFYPKITHLSTFVLMSISSIGVAQELAQKKTIMCACLGTVFKFPMTYVTLFEDLLMASMALIGLLLEL